MKKIIIYPHNCSREEYKELVSYLDNQSWDFNKITDGTNDAEKLKKSFARVIDLAEDLIETMPQKGNTSSECQRTALQQAINEFSYVVNGVETEDLIQETEIDMFKEEWGQSHEEICSNLGYDEDSADDLLKDNYFWDAEDEIWLNKDSSLFTKRDKQIADYLRHK